MMKILCAVAVMLAASVHAAPASTFATWHMADLDDVTQAWYFTGEALSGQHRDGAPWASDRGTLRLADTALAPVPPPVPAAVPVPIVPTRIDVPPTIPEPGMASMLLVGLVVIFLRIHRNDERFG